MLLGPAQFYLINLDLSGSQPRNQQALQASQARLITSTASSSSSSDKNADATATVHTNCL